MAPVGCAARRSAGRWPRCCVNASHWPLAERYERRSMLIIFKNPMTTQAAIDRHVHHSVILEFDVPSYRNPKPGLAGAKTNGAKNEGAAAQ